MCFLHAFCFGHYLFLNIFLHIFLLLLLLLLLLFSSSSSKSSIKVVVVVVWMTATMVLLSVHLFTLPTILMLPLLLAQQFLHPCTWHTISVQVSITQRPSPHTTLYPKHTPLPPRTPRPNQVHITITTTTASPPTLFYHHPNHKHLCNILCFATKLLFLDCLSLKTKAQQSMETSQPTEPMTQHHIPDYLNLHFLSIEKKTN